MQAKYYNISVLSLYDNGADGVGRWLFVACGDEKLSGSTHFRYTRKEIATVV